MEEMLELETRRDIYNLIKENPGLHLSRIANLLDMSVSLVEYHLRYMEKNNIVVAEKSGGYKRFFPKERKVKREDKKLLSLVRQEIPLKIVLLLLDRGKMTHKELLTNIDIAPSTLSYHLKKLSKKEIINSKRYGNKKGFEINKKEEILNLLVKYKPYDALESFKDIWMDLTV